VPVWSAAEINSAIIALRTACLNMFEWSNLRFARRAKAAFSLMLQSFSNKANRILAEANGSRRRIVFAESVSY
jgi:hypothetical protein